MGINWHDQKEIFLFSLWEQGDSFIGNIGGPIIRNFYKIKGEETATITPQKWKCLELSHSEY